MIFLEHRLYYTMRFYDRIVIEIIIGKLRFNGNSRVLCRFIGIIVG